jgi:peptidoglycan/xylan/chitin deacetylase (PgdA/CDA1 family)
MIDPLLTLWEALAPHPRVRRPIVLSLHEVRSPEWLLVLGTALKRKWSPIALGEFMRLHRAGALKREHMAITFDDGFRTMRTIVEPVFSELEIPFTTFVCGEVIEGGPAPWFYRVEGLLRAHPAPGLARFWGLPAESMTSGFVLVNALKAAPLSRVLDGLDRAEREMDDCPGQLREDFLSPTDLAALAGNPLATVGSHSMRHPILSSLTAEEQEWEIDQSGRILAGIIGYPPRVFAYPNGKPEDFGTETIAALRRHGFEGAVTTVQQPVAKHDDPYCLPRLGVSEGDGVRKIRLKRAIPWPGRGDFVEAKTRRRFASTWSSAG